MALIKVGYVLAVAVLVAAMPPESPAPAAIRNTELLQEETQGFSESQQYNDFPQPNPNFGQRDAFPSQDEQDFQNVRDSFRAENNNANFQNQRDSSLNQRFDAQPNPRSFGEIQGQSPQSDFRPDFNSEQRDFRDPQSQNFRQNAFEGPIQRNNEPVSQDFNQRQDNRERFQDQRLDQHQQFSAAGLRGAVNQEVQNSAKQELQKPFADNRNTQRSENKQYESENQENPLGNYQYSYDIRSEDTGDMKYHKESRDGNKVVGEYRVKEADGTMRIVKYTADAENGFQATVEYVPENVEPKEFGEKMKPKTSSSRNQQNLGSRRTFEPSRRNSQRPNRNRSRFQDQSQVEKESMALFFDPSTQQQRPVRPRPEFQQSTDRRLEQDSQRFVNNNQDSSNSRPLFQEQEFTDGQFPVEAPRQQFQTQVDSRSQEQRRESLAIQNREKHQFSGPQQQFQAQIDPSFMEQNRNPLPVRNRDAHQFQDRSRFSSQERNQFQSRNRNQLRAQESYGFQNQQIEETRNQFNDQDQHQFQNQQTDEFQNEERNRFQAQIPNQFQNQNQINEREQYSFRDENRFQGNDESQFQFQENNRFQSQRQNPFDQERNSFRNQEQYSTRDETRFQQQDIQSQERTSFRNREQFQPQRSQYNFDEDSRSMSQFDAQRHQPFNSQRTVRPDAELRDRSRSREIGQFKNPIENQQINQNFDEFNSQDNQFQNFRENSFSQQRRNSFSQSRNRFQNQDRQFRGSSDTAGPQRQPEDQNIGSSFGRQNLADAENRFQSPDEGRNLFDGQRPFSGERYGIDQQQRQFSGQGVYHEMNDKRYENQRYGQGSVDFSQNEPNFNQAVGPQREFLNPENSFGPERETSQFRYPEDASRDQDSQQFASNYQQNDQLRDGPIRQGPYSQTPNFQNQFNSANNFEANVNRPFPSEQSFQRENFSQDSRFGFQRDTADFQQPQDNINVSLDQRFETIAEPHPQA